MEAVVCPIVVSICAWYTVFYITEDTFNCSPSARSLMVRYDYTRQITFFSFISICEKIGDNEKEHR